MRHSQGCVLHFFKEKEKKKTIIKDQNNNNISHCSKCAAIRLRQHIQKKNFIHFFFFICVGTHHIMVSFYEEKRKSWRIQVIDFFFLLSFLYYFAFAVVCTLHGHSTFDKIFISIALHIHERNFIN